MSGPEPLPPEARRQLRCDARLGCWLRAASKEALGFTTNVGTGGLFVRVGPDAFGATPLEVGAKVGFQLVLPEQQAPVEGNGCVAWLDPEDRDAGDRRVLGVGLDAVGFAGDGRERLEAFVQGFRHTVLVIDEDADYIDFYRSLRDEYRVVRAPDAASGMKLLESQEVSVLIVSEQLADSQGLAFLQRLSERFPNARTSRLMVSEFTVAGQVQEFISLGELFSYLRKPFSRHYLRQLIRRAADAYALARENELLSTELERANQQLLRENAYLRKRFVGFEGFEEIVGRSRELRRVVDQVERIRRSDATVHIQGETGTGKELVARALHSGGPRKKGPFVAQSCAGLSEGLLQSVLFGHRKGAFTGADKDFAGVFQRADGGTLFLDEVAELSPTIQAALLRTLQSGDVTPVGARAPVRVDVRIVSATHKDLREEVRQGRFREDLYFRLVVIPIVLPALRERSGDIPILAMHFLDLHCELKGKAIRGFSYGAMRALERYRWPGNVRELENEIERLVVLTGDHHKVPVELVSPHLREEGEATAPAPAPGDGLWIPAGASYDAAVALLERTLISEALAQAGGNVSQAARALGMERSRLAKLRDRLGL